MIDHRQQAIKYHLSTGTLWYFIMAVNLEKLDWRCGGLGKKWQGRRSKIESQLLRQGAFHC